MAYIHHTCEHRQYCCGATAQHCRLGLFQDSDFAGDFEDSKPTSGGILCILGSHTFVPKSRMCKKPQFHTVLRKLKSFLSRCRFTHGRYSRSRSLGFSDWSISFFRKQTNKTKDVREPRVNLSVVRPNMRKTNSNQARWSKIWPILITFHQTEHIPVPMQCCARLWGQWSLD